MAAGPDRSARFEREAQMLASLKRPDIAAIHRIKQGAIMMESEDGADLAGTVPIARAKQIAARLGGGA